MFSFGTHLKELRKSRKITQKQLAKDIGASERGIQQYELGERKPTYDMLISLAEYFHVPLDYLTGRGIFKDWDKIMEKKEIVIDSLLCLYPYLDLLDLQNQPEEVLMSVLPSLIKKIDFLKGDKIVIYPLLPLEKSDQNQQQT